MIKEKIEELQVATLGLIHQEVSVLENQLKDLINARIDQLGQERMVIEQHQKELQQKLAKLPQQWVSERLINQQMETNAHMVEEITRLVESKNTASNLDVIQSAPVDLALIPVQPKSPRIMLFAFLGGTLGVFLTISTAFGRTLLRGFPVSAENLYLAKQHVSGHLSQAPDMTKPLSDRDLSTLRNVSVNLRGYSAALILGETGLDYSSILAELFSKQGKKVVLIPLFFDCIKQTPQNGLLAYLEGRTQTLSIQTQKGYDYVQPDGVTRFAHELLNSERFFQLLVDLTNRYDKILFVTYASVNSPEAEQLLFFCDSGVITIGQQTWLEIERCIKLAADKNLTFILSDTYA